MLLHGHAGDVPGKTHLALCLMSCVLNRSQRLHADVIRIINAYYHAIEITRDAMAYCLFG